MSNIGVACRRKPAKPPLYPLCISTSRDITCPPLCILTQPHKQWSQSLLMMTLHRRLTIVVHPSHIPVVGVLERWPRILFAHGYRSQKHHLLWQVRLHVFIGEMGWQTLPRRCVPQAWGHHRWRKGPRWGQHSVPEVGCRLTQSEGDHWGCSVSLSSTCNYALVCMCVCVFVNYLYRQRRAADTRLFCTDTPSSCGIPSALW